MRRSYRLPSLGHDLRRIYTDADHVLYSDVPEMFPAHDLPDTHSYLGPVTWSPPTPPPAWWDAMAADAPIIYLTLGSSGQGALLPRILRALAPMPVRVIAATAGQVDPGPLPDNARAAAYLPGEEAARRARLVICNGGSPTSQQALAAGVPVLGIAGNLDQYLNMQGVVAAGAGALLRSDRLNPELLRAKVVELLEEPAARAAAGRMAQLFDGYDIGERWPSYFALRAAPLGAPGARQVTSAGCGGVGDPDGDGILILSGHLVFNDASFTAAGPVGTGSFDSRFMIDYVDPAYLDIVTGSIFQDKITGTTNVPSFFTPTSMWDGATPTTVPFLKVDSSQSFAAVPEPATLALIGLGFVGLAMGSRRKAQS